jgi:DNA-binding ferritin-like protein (Dps family)
MNEFFDNYFNIKKIRESKREYKRNMARVEAMPKDYRYVFKKIQKHMWMFAGGAGYDMMKIHYELIDLFEDGVANGRPVLEITGDDVAGFCDELMRNARTYTDDWKQSMNKDIMNKLGKKDDSND